MIATLNDVQTLSAVLTVVQTLSATLTTYGSMSCTLTAVETPTLSATLTGIQGMTATLTGVGNLTAELTIPPYVSGATYSGSYTVQPTWTEQVLDTANKVMSDDVTVESIYINSAENLSGGNTVYIGA